MLVKKRKLPVAHLMLFGWMPSFIKTSVYRLMGYRIGKGVCIGFGSVIVANEVTVGPEARIGFLCVVMGRSVELGPRVSIGSLTYMDTFEIRIGEGTRINSQVVVGGLQTPKSSLMMGKNCILMEWSVVNTSMPIVIGDDVGIGGHCLLFTHGLWPSGFEGFPVNFGPIRIGDRAWLAWRVSVLPGASIGEGSIVSTDACVIGEIPAHVLAGGVPAKPLRDNASFLRPHDENANRLRLKNLLQDFKEWLTFNGLQAKSDGDNRIAILAGRGRRYDLLVRLNPDEPISDFRHPKFGCFVSLSPVADDEKATLDRQGVCWFDILNKRRGYADNDLAEEVEEFFRRQGHRFVKYS